MFFDKSFFNAKWLDTAISHWLSYPLAVLVNNALSHGELPLWNPFSGLGAPLSIELQAAFYSPFHWIAFIAPSARSWDLVFFTTVRLRFK